MFRIARSGGAGSPVAPGVCLAMTRRWRGARCSRVRGLAVAIAFATGCTLDTLSSHREAGAAGRGDPGSCVRAATRRRAFVWCDRSNAAQRRRRGGAVPATWIATPASRARNDSSLGCSVLRCLAMTRRSVGGRFPPERSTPCRVIARPAQPAVAIQVHAYGALHGDGRSCGATVPMPRNGVAAEVQFPPPGLPRAVRTRNDSSPAWCALPGPVVVR